MIPTAAVHCPARPEFTLPGHTLPHPPVLVLQQCPDKQGTNLDPKVQADIIIYQTLKVWAQSTGRALELIHPAQVLWYATQKLCFGDLSDSHFSF